MGMSVKSLLAAVGLILGMGAVVQPATADSAAVQMPGTAHYYQVVTSSLTWEEARAAAHAMTFNGQVGHLVTITTSAESDFVQSLVNSSGAASVWGGAGDIGSSGGFARRWAWVDGPEAGLIFTVCTGGGAAYSGGNSCQRVDGQFANWTKVIAEPDGYNGYGGGLNRLLLDYESRHSGWWDNDPRWPSTAFVVEFEPPSSPVQMPGTNHWYQLMPERKAWEEARDSAASMVYQGMTGHLATITSQAEQDFITTSFAGHRDVYVGAKDTGPGSGYARIWTWVVGPEAGTVFTRCAESRWNNSCQQTPGTFAIWGPNQPDNMMCVLACENQIYLQILWNQDNGTWDDVNAAWQPAGGGGFLVEFEPQLPESPSSVSASASDGSATVSWALGADGGSPVTGFSVTTAPGGRTCTTTAMSCTVTGLTNRQPYSFTVTASNAVGTSEPSSPSAEVVPLAAGFQAWASDLVTTVGGSTTLNIAQAASVSSVAVTGALKASVGTDSSGFARVSYTATKDGIQKFTVSYSGKVGKKTTKYTTTAQFYVPSAGGPGKVKTGKAGKFSVSYAPPGADVWIQLSDGRTLTLKADSAGKASISPTFTTVGAVTYTLSVSGVQIATGGITVTR